MKLYNQYKQTKIFDIRDSLCINYGNTANIYKIGENILKKYYTYTNDKYKLDLEVFEILKQINSDNLIKIYEILYENISLLEIIGYIAKYYEDKNINIFNKDLDYVLDNMNQIEKLFEIFTENSIKVNDVKYKNTILTDEKIILIDPDAYKKVDSTKENLKIINKKELLLLVRSIYLYCSSTKEECKKIYSLFDIKVDASTNVTYELSKILKK